MISVIRVGEGEEEERELQVLELCVTWGSYPPPHLSADYPLTSLFALLSSCARLYGIFPEFIVLSLTFCCAETFPPGVIIIAPVSFHVQCSVLQKERKWERVGGDSGSWGNIPYYVWLPLEYLKTGPKLFWPRIFWLLSFHWPLPPSIFPSYFCLDDLSFPKLLQVTGNPHYWKMLFSYLNSPLSMVSPNTSSRGRRGSLTADNNFEFKKGHCL